MAGLFPNPSADVRNFSVGDQVKWFVSERAISPYVGVVTEVIPAIQKIWVDFPVGGCQQKDPTELILVTKFVGESPVKEDTGYDSFDKEVSNKEYGRLGDKAKGMAKKILKKKASGDGDYDRTYEVIQAMPTPMPPSIVKQRYGQDAFLTHNARMFADAKTGDQWTGGTDAIVRPVQKDGEEIKEEPSKGMKYAASIAQKFATDVVEKLAGDVVVCAGQGMSDIQTYQHLYPQYEKICSDAFLRTSISKIYKEAAVPNPDPRMQPPPPASVAQARAGIPTPGATPAVTPDPKPAQPFPTRPPSAEDAIRLRDDPEFKQQVQHIFTTDDAAKKFFLSMPKSEQASWDEQASRILAGVSKEAGEKTASGAIPKNMSAKLVAAIVNRLSKMTATSAQPVR